jgi:hypothetical protein
MGGRAPALQRGPGRGAAALSPSDPVGCQDRPETQYGPGSESGAEGELVEWNW